VPAGEWITCIGPIAARQLVEQRLPILSELDAVPRPVYIQAAQGGTRTNTAGRAILNANGITNINDDGVIGGGATGSSGALQFLRSTLLTPETRRRSSTTALAYYNTLGITTHGDKGAFHSELPSGGIASENTYTMHFPFLELDAANALPSRMRIDFLHQDSANDPSLPTLAPRLRNSFKFFGNDWFRTMGIGEFTGGGLNGLIAIAQAGWRGEDHSLSLNNFAGLVSLREQANAVAPIVDLQWIISHVPGTSPELVDRWHQLGGGLAVGWGPTRTGTNVGPAYRDIIESGIPVGFHSDGGDITVINPWLNLYTMITGRNLSGDHILGEQTVTRREAIWLATALLVRSINEIAGRSPIPPGK
jgi:predicted amidohydrolase YtcJ